jgi:hypothetical protein
MSVNTKRGVLVAVFGFVLYLTAVGIGFRGVDFGFHWDEPLWIGAVQDSFQTWVFLPHTYYYGGVIYNVGVLAAGSYLLNTQTARGPEIRQQALQSRSFYLFCRKVFIAISLMAILWTGAAAWLLSGGSPVRTMAAMMVVAGSWEFEYHARWIAPDTLLASFSIFTLCVALLAERKRSLPILCGAALLSGVCFATKYPGGLTLLLVLGVAFWNPQWRTLRHFGLLGTLFAVVFLMITPGAVLDPVLFYTQLRQISLMYAVNGHGGYTVGAGLPHLGLMLSYLSRAAFSRYEWISVILFGLAVYGGIRLFQAAKNQKRFLLFAIALFPLVYIVYFSSQRVMIVRNLMILIPVFALLAAEGIAGLMDRFKIWSPWYPRLVALGFSFFFILNMSWQVKAASSIVSYPLISKFPATELPAGKSIWVSKSLQAKFEGLGPLSPRDQAEILVFQSSDIGDYAHNWAKLPADMRGEYHLLSFGPFEVNYDFYPSWRGPDRPIWVYASFADRSGLKDMLN